MLITVFTPTYNRADKLHRVFNSLKKQTLKKIHGNFVFEWLIVDDGSEDNTKKLVEKWKEEVDFPIRYIYQENQGKIKALIKGIENSNSELFLILDSDDECMPETIEFFYNIWNRFNDYEKDNCLEICVLCQDQWGNRVGNNFPISNQFVNIIEFTIGWKTYKLGETWAILRTDVLKEIFILHGKDNDLRFIPESFFWDKMSFLYKDKVVYPVNKILRIYYRNEHNNLSHNVRSKYPEGFLFESKWVVKNYWKFMFKYPRYYFKHLLKVIYFTFKTFKGK